MPCYFAYYNTNYTTPTSMATRKHKLIAIVYHDNLHTVLRTQQEQHPSYGEEEAELGIQSANKHYFNIIRQSSMVCFVQWYTRPHGKTHQHYERHGGPKDTAQRTTRVCTHWQRRTTASRPRRCAQQPTKAPATSRAPPTKTSSS